MCSQGDLKMNSGNKGPRVMYTSSSQVPRLGEEWRHSPPWNAQTLQKLKDDVRSIAPPSNSQVQHLNVLMQGPVGAGKSSFFNTISSTFQGHLSGQALSGSAEKSITSKLKFYKVRDAARNNVEMKFRLCDTRGLEENHVDADEFKLILDGHFTDGYEHGTVVTTKPYSLFRLVTYLKDFIFGLVRTPRPNKTYKENPTMADKMHCVCFVLDGSNVGTLDGSVIAGKIKRLQEICLKKEVPFVVLLTKTDVVCGEVSKHVSSVFHSTTVRGVVEEAEKVFDISTEKVLTVKNYGKEADILDDVSILALLALKIMLGRAKDCLLNKFDYEQLEGKDTPETCVVHMTSELSQI